MGQFQAVLTPRNILKLDYCFLVYHLVILNNMLSLRMVQVNEAVQQVLQIKDVFLSSL